MAQRPIWRGQLRLALVSCPVALFSAHHDRGSLHFNLINPDTGNRIRMITQDAETGKELERRDLVKGYEFRKNRYLLLNDEDLNSVKVESSRGVAFRICLTSDSLLPGSKQIDSTRWPEKLSSGGHVGRVWRMLGGS